jgi:hypothetical protein
MAKLAENARATLVTKLEPGEELRSVGLFRTGPFWAMVLLSSWFTFAMKYWWIGVTTKRLIIVRINSFYKPMTQNNYSVALTDVQVEGNTLVVKLPDNPKPQKFPMFFGLKAMTGFDAGEFKVALGVPA